MLTPSAARKDSTPLASEGPAVEKRTPEGKLIEGKSMPEDRAVEERPPEGKLIEGESIPEERAMEERPPEGKLVEGESIPEERAMEERPPEGKPVEGESIPEERAMEERPPEGKPVEAESIAAEREGTWSHEAAVASKGRPSKAASKVPPTEATSAAKRRCTQRRAGRDNRRGDQSNHHLVDHSAPPLVRRCTPAFTNETQQF
jgi:hypothetical protein